MAQRIDGPNAAEALILATDAGIRVAEDSRTREKVDDRNGRRVPRAVFFRVGAAVVFHDWTRGGSACWEVLFRGRVFGHGLRGAALAFAVELQAPGRAGVLGLGFQPQNRREREAGEEIPEEIRAAV